jgi:hypothetical protein
MPHNVYTGDEEGRVVRSNFPHLQEWFGRKEGLVDGNQVGWSRHEGRYGVAVSSLFLFVYSPFFSLRVWWILIWCRGRPLVKEYTDEQLLTSPYSMNGIV